MSIPSPHHADPFLTLEDVTLRLYEKLLFQQTHWRFLADQHWAVIGRNGAGKTTLMKALCGQIPVVSGQIVYHFGARPHERIAYVSFDDFRAALGSQNSFYQARWNRGVGDGRTYVSEYLSESSVKHINPYQVQETPTDDRHASDRAAFARQRQRVIELLDIKDLLHKEIIQLSDGERRKTSIARALLLHPQLLILDNPLTGLDQRSRIRLTEIVEGLMQGGIEESMRVIVVTPRRDEIPSSVTHVLLVEDCRVIAHGPKETVLESDAAHALMEHDHSTNAGQARRQRALRLPPAKAPAQPEPEPRVLVDMRRIHVAYGPTQILHDVDWTVQRGEHWALLGPNGAGKSTLLSLILGDHPQVYANDVRLFGQRRGSGESIWEIKRRIGWVAPELQLYYPRNVTALQVVESGFYDSVGLYRTCSPEQRSAAQQWMEELDIRDRADVPFAKLSEGEQRLTLLARALVKRPLLLILDEPCQGLDARNRMRVRQVVDATGNDTDASVIYVTHNADELPQIITHVLRLDRGRKAQAGSEGQPSDPEPMPPTGKDRSRLLAFQ